ncbi:hypothetical protein [Methanobrevibacter sp.]|uniref:hypothetical protein n=1 Tax=Methanobrevibacter sp. TaxID=66852 RepID=UPI00388DF49B
MKPKYTITEDILFKNFLRSKPNITKATIIHYTSALIKFHKAIEEPLETIIANCKNQQDKVIETTTNTTVDEKGNTIIEKTITEFDVNRPEAYINIYINTFIDYCKKTGIKNNSINNYLTQISAVLLFYGVKLPNIEKFKRQTPSWNLLQKEDFKFIIQDSILSHAGLIKHLESTGMRLRDALSISLGEYMIATSEYHNYTDVNDFIDNAPQDMIATWEFIPEKTKKFNIPCITFSDPETNNLILQNLRKIKNEYLPRLNKERGLNLRLTKDDALFSSRKANYKGHLAPRSVSDMFYKKNKKLKEHHINLIKEAIEKGNLASEDYEKEVNKIPKFHAHGCRKYFISTISKNCGDLRLCALMEGHTTPLATDSAYVKHDVKDVKEVYMSAIPDLSLENAETKIYTSDIRREMESKLQQLVEQNKQLKSELSEINDIKERVLRLEKKSDD